MLRAFIAMELSPLIHQKLDQIIQILISLDVSPVRWVPAHNIHITLKFLGDVTGQQINDLSTALQKEMPLHHPFEIHVGGLGAFPNSKRARVLWVGLQAPPELAQLQNRVETITAQMGFPKEERRFSPHLTLGRVNQKATPQQVKNIGEILPKAHTDSLGTTKADTVVIFRSELFPSGAVYSPLFAVHLTDQIC